AVVEVAPPRQNRVWATPGEGGWLRSEDGRVDLRAPAGAMPRRTELRYMVENSLPSLPEHLVYAFRLESRDEAGQPVAQFAAPLTLSAFFDVRWLPPGALERLALFHLNKESRQWEVVPSRIDPRWRRVVAQIDQLAAPSAVAKDGADQSRQRTANDDGSETYALGQSADVVEQFITERMSSLRGAQTNLFSLSIGYSYRFDLPPGRGGLTPLLGLNYSSANHTPASGHHSVAGFGWELAGADYVYIPPGDPNLNKITLSLQGRTYSLREGANSKWYAVEDPFMKVEPGSWSHGTAGSWTVWTQNGTKYSFFDEPYPSASHYWKICTGCTTGKRYVRIPLREIEDTSGNKIHLTWVGENQEGPWIWLPNEPPVKSPDYTRAIRLTEIMYNNGKTRVVLSYPQEPRADRPDSYDIATWRFYTEMRLATVTVQVRANGTGDWRTVRSYALEHDFGPTAQPSQKVMNLEWIEERNAAGDALPRTEFDYSDDFFSLQSEFGAMTQARNGYGGEIVFVSDHRDGNGNNARIVSARTEKYGVVDLVDQTWSYTGVNWDESGGNEMAKGYREVRVTRPDGALEKHFFHGIETVNGNASDHLAGRKKELIVEKPAGAQLARTVTSWEASTDRLPVGPAPNVEERIKPRHVRVAYTETFEAGKQLVRTEYSYDPNKQGGTQWGNVTRILEKVWTGGAWSNPYRASYVWYVPNVAQSITNKPARIELYDGCADCSGVSPGSIVSQRLLYYDQDTAGNWQQAPTLGRLRFETIGSGVPGSTPLLSTEYQYWSNGNLRKVIDGLQRASETFYDSQFQAYPVCVKNALGHTTKTRYYGVPGSTNSGCVTGDGSPAWNGAQQAANAFFGQTEDITDANNALTSFDYDTWGRVLRVWRPGESKGATGHAATEVFTYQNSGPFKVKHSRRDDLGGTNAATYLESYTFYDTFGRVVQTQSEAASAGRIIVANTRINGLDQVIRQSLPYEVVATLGDYQTPNWGQPKTETSYDGLGRVLTVINPNGSQRQTRYRFDATMANREIGVVDELGHQEIQEIDAFGRLVKAKQYTVTVTGSPPVPNWSATVYAAASYEYDVADRLKRMVGPDNAETIISYDALGRKTSMSDPNMGAWLYRYDAAGNLGKQRDAKNVMTCFHYDSLNRLVGKSFHPNTPDPASVNCSTQPTPYPVAYSYDAGPNGKGRRSSAAVYNNAGSVSNSVSWTYDSRGRVTKETVSVTPPGFTSALSYETDTSYDAADRLRSMTYPADVGGREIVTTAYNTQGLPYSLTSSTGATYVSSTTYDALGRLDQQMLGNALKVDRDYWGWSEADGGGRLKRIFLLKAPYNSGNQSDKLQDLMYRYDVAGNVTNIQDTINRSGNEFQRECFSYDALNRLTRGFSTGAATCNNNPGAVGSGVYDQSYAFTANGNLASKTGVGSYTYSASSPSDCATGTQATKPHAVKTAGGATYTYDCNGNMTGRTATGSTVTLAYDAENRLASVTDLAQPPGRQTAFYQYNADGQRVVKTDTVNGTLFVGNHMEANWTTGPLAWPLGDFEAIDQGDNILVSWVTLFETELLGFNLHRSTDPDRPEQQLNPAVIPVQNPGSTTGAFYTWLDEEVEQGKPYYYWLELLTPSGSEWAGPIGVGEGRLPTSQSPQVTGPNSYRRYYYLGGQRIATRFVYATGSVLN
ncbi:MAG TPA: hypothetical protein PK170_02365, partial [Anaerolineae bacterium]|nr:hypothetical protein [Anaerolineae bacterium]